MGSSWSGPQDPLATEAAVPPAPPAPAFPEPTAPAVPVPQAPAPAASASPVPTAPALPAAADPASPLAGPQASPVQEPIFKNCGSCRVLSGSAIFAAGAYVYLVARRPLKRGYSPGPGTILQMAFGISIACWGVVVLIDPKGKAYRVV